MYYFELHTGEKKKWNSDKDISLSGYTWWAIRWVNSIISDGWL